MPATWRYQRGSLTQYARSFDRAARLVPHSHWFARVILTLIFWVDPERFAQTIGPCVLVHDSWSAEKVRRLIPHEVGGHMRQYRWCGLGIHPWAGLPVMFVLYVLLPIPLGLAYFRYRLELHADSQAWRSALNTGNMTGQDVLDRARSFADTVSGRNYGWAWPRRWARWGFERVARRVIEEYAHAGPRE